MPRPKRSEKRVAPTVEPGIRPLPAAERIYAALCPCCGRTIPENRAIKIGHVTVDRVSYFGSIDWDPNKPFGVSFATGGKGAFKDNEPINPEDAPELFDAVKRRLLDAMGEWIKKGWIREEELIGTR